MHVSLDAEGRPILDDVVEHDSVTDVLRYVGFDRRHLLGRVRRAVEDALRAGSMTLAESALFLKDYERSLAGPTYLEEDGPDEGTYGMERYGRLVSDYPLDRPPPWSCRDRRCHGDHVHGG